MPLKPLRAPQALSVTRAQAVALLGVSDRTYARLEAEGVIKATTPGTGRRPSVYDAGAVVRAYLAHRERKLTGSLEHPRDRRDTSQAELNELRLARERRELLPRADVVREGTAFIGAVTAKLRALPSRLVRAGVIPATAEPRVAACIADMQSEMARWRTELDLLAATDDAP
jgi:hypothetical protein